MGDTGGNISETNLGKVAQLYLLIELQKMFSDIKDDEFWKKLSDSLVNFQDRNNASTFWGLISGISEAVRLNSIHQYLTDDSFSWTLEKVKLDNITLTGMEPAINKYTLEQCKSNPKDFLIQWNCNKAMRDNLLRCGISEKVFTNKMFPIIVLEKENHFIVIDGMHRTLSSLISNKNSILAWVGRITNPTGKPLINSGMSMLLQRVWQNAKNKDDELKTAIHRIGTELIFNYRNGHESLIDRIVGWSSDKDFKNIFNN